MPVYQTDGGLRVDWKSGVIRIHQILNDDNLKNRLAKDCKKIALNKYSPDLFALRLKEVLREVVSNRRKEFVPLELNKLLDKDTLDFFTELELALDKHNSVDKAREGLFKNDHFSRLKIFWSAYSGDIKHVWFGYDVPYVPLKIKKSKGYVEIDDRNWPSKQRLTKEEKRVLTLIDGKISVLEMGSKLGFNETKIIDIMQTLQVKGLILPTAL